MCIAVAAHAHRSRNWKLSLNTLKSTDFKSSFREFEVTRKGSTDVISSKGVKNVNTVLKKD
jgi:hypothetical protein